MKLRDIAFARPAASWAQLPDDGLPEVALVGRSNVGKSSLFNALVARKGLARTSQTPGKTQTLNFYRAEPAPAAGRPARPPFYLVDLPGMGYAKVAQAQRAAWGRLMERYLQERAADDGPLALVVQLVDSRHDPQPLDLAMLDLLRGGPAPFVLALTKSDKLSKNQQAARVATLKRQLAAEGLEPMLVLTSAEKKEGLDALWGWIATFLPH